MLSQVQTEQEVKRTSELTFYLIFSIVQFQKLRVPRSQRQFTPLIK